MRFAVIGTGAIVEKFISAARLCPDFSLEAVYSRTLSRATEFAAAQGAPRAFCDLEQLAACDAVDAVYVASPNYAHCAHSLQMMRAGKHVLCEKPMASNAREVEKMLACAKENGVTLLEAMKTVFDPGFYALQEALPRIGTLRHVTASYCQYSSRYDAFLAGKVLNAFDPTLSNGALMDIGVYCVHPLVKLFGAPDAVAAMGTKLPGGVDGAGTLLLSYPGFTATLTYSKVSDGTLSSELQGEKGSIVVENFHTPQVLRLPLRGQAPQILPVPCEAQTMRYETAHFIRVAAAHLPTPHEDAASRTAARVMDQARAQMGIVFPADGE